MLAKVDDSRLRPQEAVRMVTRAILGEACAGKEAVLVEKVGELTEWGNHRASHLGGLLDFVMSNDGH